MNRSAPRLLLTGAPGCGKTTVLRRTVELLLAVPSPGSTAAGQLQTSTEPLLASKVAAAAGIVGFYTQEIREHGRRLGFDAVGLRGSRAVMAHIGFRGQAQVGRYGVDLAAFDSLLRAELTAGDGEIQLAVIDEIGKMECFSSLFVEFVDRLLESPAALLATVAAKGGGLIAAVKLRPDVELTTVTTTNRDRLPQQLAENLRTYLAQRAGR